MRACMSACERGRERGSKFIIGMNLRSLLKSKDHICSRSNIKTII